MTLIKVEKELHFVPLFHAKIINKFINSSSIAVLNVGGVARNYSKKNDRSFVGFDIGPKWTN